MPDALGLSKDALLQVLATDGPLDSETVRNGRMLLWSRECDFEATSKLLTRYLAQPLSDSETAWAYINLANSLAVTGHAAEAVHAHETFERWLPGKSSRLSSTWPYYPAPDGSPEVRMGPDEIRVTFLAQSVEFATAYAAVGRYADYVAKADAALAGLTPTQDNLEVRFYGPDLHDGVPGGRRFRASGTTPSGDARDRGPGGEPVEGRGAARIRRDIRDSTGARTE